MRLMLLLIHIARTKKSGIFILVRLLGGGRFWAGAVIGRV